MSTQDRPPRSRSSPLALPVLAAALAGAHCSSGGVASTDASTDARAPHDAYVAPHPGHDATVDSTLPPGFDAGVDAGPLTDAGCTLPAPFEDAGSRVSELRTTLDAWAASFETAYAGDAGLVCPRRRAASWSGT